MVKDKYHEMVKTALENEGWDITDDPYYLKVGKRKGYIDLAAERLFIGAEKGNEKIAIEIKTFSSQSDLSSFEDAIGQFLIYHFALSEKEPERILYLATPLNFYERFFDDTFFIRFTQFYHIKLIVYNELSPIIEKWID